MVILDVTGHASYENCSRPASQDGAGPFGVQRWCRPASVVQRVLRRENLPTIHAVRDRRALSRPAWHRLRRPCGKALAYVRTGGGHPQKRRLIRKDPKTGTEAPPPRAESAGHPGRPRAAPSRWVSFAGPLRAPGPIRERPRTPRGRIPTDTPREAAMPAGPPTTSAVHASSSRQTGGAPDDAADRRGRDGTQEPAAEPGADAGEHRPPDGLEGRPASSGTVLPGDAEHRAGEGAASVRRRHRSCPSGRVVSDLFPGHRIGAAAGVIWSERVSPASGAPRSSTPSIRVVRCRGASRRSVRAGGRRRGRGAVPGGPMPTTSARRSTPYAISDPTIDRSWRLSPRSRPRGDAGRRGPRASRIVRQAFRSGGGHAAGLAAEPEPLEHHGGPARDRHTGPAEPAPPCEARRAGSQRAPFPAVVDLPVRGLVERTSHARVAYAADAPRPSHLARLPSPGRRGEVGARAARPPEPRAVIHADHVDQRHRRADPGDARPPSHRRRPGARGDQSCAWGAPARVGAAGSRRSGRPEAGRRSWRAPPFGPQDRPGGVAQMQ